MMLSCGHTEACKASSSCNCFGRRRPDLKACSLLMNLTAITGAGAFNGIALRILVDGESQPPFSCCCEYVPPYDAYAPEPMVFDTSRKGRVDGRGTACDCIHGSVHVLVCA